MISIISVYKNCCKTQETLFIWWISHSSLNEPLELGKRKSSEISVNPKEETKIGWLWCASFWVFFWWRLRMKSFFFFSYVLKFYKYFNGIVIFSLMRGYEGVREVNVMIHLEIILKYILILVCDRRWETRPTSVKVKISVFDENKIHKSARAPEKFFWYHRTRLYQKKKINFWGLTTFQPILTVLSSSCFAAMGLVSRIPSHLWSWGQQ